MKSRKSCKWDNVKEVITKFINENRIASMMEVYEIANQYLHLKYSTPFLEKLAAFAVTDCDCFRIDLSVPYKKPLAIYPNHHKVTSTTFFVPEQTNDDHQSDAERAKRVLDEMTKAAIELEKSKKKSKPKKDTFFTEEKNIEIPEKSIKHTENQFRSRDCMNNGFIPMKAVQIQIMHLFIFDTFGTRPFTVGEFIEKMSLDLYSKIIGIKNIPDVLLKDIRLRHILVSCFPPRIKEMIQFSEIEDVLAANFKRISDANFGRFCRPFLRKLNNKFQLIDSISFNFLDQFEISFSLNSQQQISEFHYTLEIIDLLENIDPHSFSLWTKRYCIDSNNLRSAANNLTRKIVKNSIIFPYYGLFPFFFNAVEKFVAKTGFNWCNLKSSLIEFFLNEDNKKIILENCMYPASGPIDFFCKGLPFYPKPLTLFSKITSKDFELLNGRTDPNLFFNFLSALMKLFPNGTITSSRENWEKAMEIFTDVTGVASADFLRGNHPGQLDFILKNKLPEYASLMSFSTANESVKLKKFDQKKLYSILKDYKESRLEEIGMAERHQSDPIDVQHVKMMKKQFLLQSEIFEVTTSEYLDRFSVNKLRFVLSRSTAEMVERLKMLSLTPIQYVTTKNAKVFLAELEDFESNDINFSEIENFSNEEEEKPSENLNLNSDFLNSTVTNGVFFLKLTNFLYSDFLKNEKACPLFSPNGLKCELYTIAPSIMYDAIASNFDELRGNPRDFGSRIEINSGAVPFFVNEEIPVSLSIDAKEDKNEESTQIDNIFVRSRRNSDRQTKSRNSITLSSFVTKSHLSDSFSLKTRCLLLPKLKNFSGDNSQTVAKKIVKKSADKLEEEFKLSSNFTNYPGDTSKALYSSFMQLFVIIYQSTTCPQTQSFVLVCRLLYAFIDHKFSAGASLDSIFEEFAAFDIAQLFSALSFMEQFGFVYRIRDNILMPTFLSDEFSTSRMIKVKSNRQPPELTEPEKPAKNSAKKAKSRKRKKIDDENEDKSESDEIESISKHVKESKQNDDVECIAPHIWINADGTFDTGLLNRMMRKIVEVVELQPGIEFQKLAQKLPAVAPSDLFEIVDALELDEVIFSVYIADQNSTQDDGESPLFTENVSCPSPPVDSTTYLYSAAVNMRNPMLRPLERNLFQTERCKLNLALVMNSDEI